MQMDVAIPVRNCSIVQNFLMVLLFINKSQYFKLLKNCIYITSYISGELKNCVRVKNTTDVTVNDCKSIHPIEVTSCSGHCDTESM